MEATRRGYRFDQRRIVAPGHRCRASSLGNSSTSQRHLKAKLAVRDGSTWLAGLPAWATGCSPSLAGGAWRSRSLGDQARAAASSVVTTMTDDAVSRSSLPLLDRPFFNKLLCIHVTRHAPSFRFAHFAEFVCRHTDGRIIQKLGAPWMSGVLDIQVGPHVLVLHLSVASAYSCAPVLPRRKWKWSVFSQLSASTWRGAQDGGVDGGNGKAQRPARIVVIVRVWICIAGMSRDGGPACASACRCLTKVRPALTRLPKWRCTRRG